MKILVVSRVLYESNGISSVIRSCYLSEPFIGCDITFVFPFGSNAEMTQELKDRGFNVVFLNNSKPIRYYLSLKKLMKIGKFDAVHAHGSSATLFIEIHAALKAGVPIRMAHCHSSGCKHKLAHKILKPFLNKELTFAIACSDLAGKWLFDRDYEILPNGIDVERFRFDEQKRKKCREQLGLADNFVLGHVANMVAAKNQIFLLEVFAEVVKKEPTAKLLFAGDGVLREQIEKKISELGVGGGVILTGCRKDACDLYQAMDVFLLPSIYEGLPVTLIEAQAAGLRCLASDAVSIQADITGKVTYLPIGKDDIKTWVKNVIAARSESGRDIGETVLNSEFNAERSAKKLKDFLLSQR